jgi:hypothetical protein
MEREHLVIRREDYVAGTRERPEIGIFTQTHSARPPAPWGRIGAGEEVWMKWAGGPVVAVATVTGFRQLERCTPEVLRASTAGFKLHDVPAYWDSLPPSFFGLVVFLGDERWLDDPFMPEGRSRGESWFVIDTGEARRRWLRASEEDRRSGPRSGRGRGSRTIPLTLRFQVLRRDDFRCTYCGRRPPEVVLHIDHVEAFSSGGATTLDNLRTSCRECNLGKGAMAL